MNLPLATTLLATLIIACGGVGPVPPPSPSPTSTPTVTPQVGEPPPEYAVRTCAALGSTPRPAGAASPGPVATIDPRPVVCPLSVVLRVGETQRFTATQQEAGRPAGSPRVTWSVSPTSLGTISDDGVFTARAVGTGTVMATTVGSFRDSGSATVTVR